MQGTNIRFSFFPTELATPAFILSFYLRLFQLEMMKDQWPTSMHLFLLSSLCLFFFPAGCVYILFLKYFIFIPVLVSFLLAVIKKNILVKATREERDPFQLPVQDDCPYVGQEIRAAGARNSWSWCTCD